MIWKKPKGSSAESSVGTGVELLWCGSLRCYARPSQSDDGDFDVVILAAGEKPTRIELGVRGATAQEAISFALTSAMTKPRPGVSLAGIEWVPRSRGGAGAVLRDDPPAVLANAQELVRADLEALGEKGWPVS